MAFVYRPSQTKPLPAGCTITTNSKGRRIAHWLTKKGKKKKALVTIGRDGKDKIKLFSDHFVAKYVDAAGEPQQKSTGCTTREAAEKILAGWVEYEERIKSGLIKPEDLQIIENQSLPLSKHFDDYDEHLQAKEATLRHRKHRRRYLNRISEACQFTRLGDLAKGPVEKWFAEAVRTKVSARVRNAVRASLFAFVNWCVDSGRLATNPFSSIPKANEKIDPRRPRAAFEESLLLRLLEATRKRPLHEALLIRRGPRKGQLAAKVRPEIRIRLELVGQERALIYKTLVLTGLRVNELSLLTVAHLNLGDSPYLDLDPKAEKNREGSRIPIRADLAEELRVWVATKQPGDCVFKVSPKLFRIMTLDLAFAGIPRKDSRGRQLDVHALRKTFCTFLAVAGVPQRVNQEAMRHNDPSLTAGVYTDAALLDVRKAIDKLPALPPPVPIISQIISVPGKSMTPGAKADKSHDSIFSDLLTQVKELTRDR